MRNPKFALRDDHVTLRHLTLTLALTLLTQVEFISGEPSQTYLTVVSIDGEVLMEEQQISNQIKYEGLEILASGSSSIS